MTNIDTMTDTELSQAIAEAMGWHIVHATLDYMTCPGHTYPLEGDWWADEKGEIQYLVKDFNPLTSWAAWGIVYEFMRGEGWASEHRQVNPDCFSWEWFSTFEDNVVFEERDSDLRRASVVAGLKALKEESK